MRSESKLASLGLLTAISASLCCITPILAILAGTSGLASTFSWLDPFRPYFIGFTLLILGMAWYQKLKPKKQIDCACDTTEKTPFIQTKQFLSIITVFSALMLAFPSYADLFFSEPNNQVELANPMDIQTIEFRIKGMTCTGFEAPVNHELSKLNGIVKALVSYENANAVV
ncbi:mercuric transport protein MerTP [Algoriphagus namhaensis]|uniref:Mercuric transport protein MerT n=1 Tax=Algoriphagus namhaensis TaxID=915353 RepID=A0ABV8AVH1_9BACT